MTVKTGSRHSSVYSGLTIYTYRVFAINVTNGNVLWRSVPIELSYEFQAQFQQFRGPEIHYDSGAVYVIGYNYTVPRASGFSLLSFDSASGELIHRQAIRYFWYNTTVYMDSFSTAAVFHNSVMQLTFATLPAYGKNGEAVKNSSSFYSIGYHLSHGIATQFSEVNFSLHNIQNAGSGDMGVYSSGDMQATGAVWYSWLVVENITSGNHRLINLTQGSLSIPGSNIYTADRNGSTISLYSWNFSTNETVRISSLRSGIPSKPDNLLSLKMKALPGPVFALSFTGSPGGNGSPVTDSHFMGICSTGKMLWNITVPGDPYGTVATIHRIGKSMVLFTTFPARDTNNRIFCSSKMVLVDYLTGNLLLSRTYGYGLDSHGNPFLGGAGQYLGELGQRNGYMVYLYGHNLACTYLGRFDEM